MVLSIVPNTDPGAFLHCDAVLIGDGVIEKDCYLGPYIIVRGDVGKNWLKRGANMQGNRIAHTFAASDMTLNEAANIGHGAILHGRRVRKGVLVGMKAVVMDEAVIR